METKRFHKSQLFKAAGRCAKPWENRTKMKKKYIFIIGGLLLFIFLFYKLGSAFAPGSYAYAEQYELNYPEKKVIEAAEKVREQNVYLHIGEGWEDKDTTDYWHHIYFNFHNRMLLTWTRPNGKNATTFAFVRM